MNHLPLEPSVLVYLRPGHGGQLAQSVQHLRLPVLGQGQPFLLKYRIIEIQSKPFLGGHFFIRSASVSRSVACGGWVFAQATALSMFSLA